MLKLTRTYGLIWVSIQHFAQKSIDFTVGAKINFAKKFGKFQFFRGGSKNWRKLWGTKNVMIFFMGYSICEDEFLWGIVFFREFSKNTPAGTADLKV